MFDRVTIDTTGNSVTVNTGGVNNCRICITSLDLEMGYQQVAENVSSHTFEDIPGRYQVTITAPNFIPFIFQSDSLITGINTFTRIYPNPAISNLTIETLQPDLYTIEITSLNGQLIYTGEMREITKQIEISSLRKGVYFVTIRSNKGVNTEKIIIL